MATKKIKKIVMIMLLCVIAPLATSRPLLGMDREEFFYDYDSALSEQEMRTRNKELLAARQEKDRQRAAQANASVVPEAVARAQHVVADFRAECRLVAERVFFDASRRNRECLTTEDVYDAEAQKVELAAAANTLNQYKRTQILQECGVLRQEKPQSRADADARLVFFVDSKKEGYAGERFELVPVEKLQSLLEMVKKHRAYCATTGGAIPESARAARAQRRLEEVIGQKLAVQETRGQVNAANQNGRRKSVSFTPAVYDADVQKVRMKKSTSLPEDMKSFQQPEAQFLQPTARLMQVLEGSEDDGEPCSPVFKRPFIPPLKLPGR